LANNTHHFTYLLGEKDESFFSGLDSDLLYIAHLAAGAQVIGSDRYRASSRTRAQVIGMHLLHLYRLLLLLRILCLKKRIQPGTKPT
jgi:hypothetical protein